MKLTTIWDLRMPMALRERLNRSREACLLIVAHRMPRSLAYWVLVDQGAHYSCVVNPHAIVPEMTFMDVLHAAEK